MKMIMYAVLDAKLGDFGNPFVSMKDEGAIRSFADCVNDGSNRNNQWFFHPEDFALYRIGEYNTATAEIIPEIGKCLVTAAAVKKDPGIFEMPVSINGKEKTPQVV